MRALVQSWLCLLILASLAAFSLISGVILELGVRSSVFSAEHYLNGKPLPWITAHLYGLHTDYTNSFFTLAFFPTLIASAYLWMLLRNPTNSLDCHLRFGLMAFACFAGMVSFLMFGILGLTLPFIPLSGGMMSGDVPPTPLFQQTIWWIFLAMLATNAALIVRLFLPFRRPTYS